MILVAFAGLGSLYFRSYVKQRSHGIILFVVNGLDLSLLNATRQQLEAARTDIKAEIRKVALQRQVHLHSHLLHIEALPHAAVINIQALGQQVADEGAASTALASGVRVKNGLIGCNSLNQPLDSLIYAAQRSGRSTGIVTTSSLLQPTPVAFYSHLRDASEKYRVAADLVDGSHIDIVLGGGGTYFSPPNVVNESGRTDGRDLISEAERKGYTIVRTADDLNNVPAWRTRELFGIFAPDQFEYIGLPQHDRRQPSLSDMTRTAIQCLQYNIGGYFLVVEHGLVGSAAKRNMTELTIDEVEALDQAIKTAIDYAGTDALIIVTNNFSLGILDQESQATQAASTRPAPIWHIGPGGPQETASQQAWYRAQVESGAFSAKKNDLLRPDPAALFATEAVPTNRPAWLAARGFDSDHFGGFYSNIELFSILEKEF